MTVQEMKLLIRQIPTDALTSLRLLIEVELLGRGISPADPEAVEAAKSRLLDENACFDRIFDALKVPFMAEL